VKIIWLEFKAYIRGACIQHADFTSQRGAPKSARFISCHGNIIWTTLGYVLLQSQLCLR